MFALNDYNLKLIVTREEHINHSQCIKDISRKYMHVYVDPERRSVNVLSHKKDKILLICLMFYIIISLVNNSEETHTNLRITK